MRDDIWTKSRRRLDELSHGMGAVRKLLDLLTTNSRTLNRCLFASRETLNVLFHEIHRKIIIDRKYRSRRYQRRRGKRVIDIRPNRQSRRNNFISDSVSSSGSYVRVFSTPGGLGLYPSRHLFPKICLDDKTTKT